MAAGCQLEETAPLDERIHWFAQAKAAFTNLGHRRFLARTLGNWGDQLLQVGQGPAAQELLQEALVLGQETQDWRSLANVLESLAEWHARQGEYDTSQNYLAEALAHVEGHDHFVELQVRLALARLHWSQGHTARARALLEQVLLQARETEARQWHVAAQLYVAEMALAAREWPRATELLQTSRPVIEQLRSPGLMGHWRLVE
jgi:tetratricopeptide (TPR) repeat protein